MQQHRRPNPATERPARAAPGRAVPVGDAGNAARVARLPGSIAPDGSLDYYSDRHDDFVEREPGRPAPDYYLGYGDRYVRRFSQQVYPLLSPAGQAWLVEVRVGLQVAIEDERDRDPRAFAALEADGPAFRRFAFDTHPQAYWDAGLGGLPVADLLTIGLTPDSEDLLSFEGVMQVSDIAGRLAGAWGADALDLLAGNGASTWLVERVADGVLATRTGVDALFGVGASDTLDRAAASLGVGLESIAQGVHGLFAGGVTAVAGAVDAVAGSGATSRATNGLREDLQQGIEVVEDAGEWAAGLWNTLTRDRDLPALS